MISYRFFDREYEVLRVYCASDKEGSGSNYDYKRDIFPFKQNTNSRSQRSRREEREITDWRKCLDGSLKNWITGDRMNPPDKIE